MPRILVVLLFMAVAASTSFAAGSVGAAAPTTVSERSFNVAPHSDVTIEWWYLNANLHTATGRRYALIGSFFRFGNAHGLVAQDSRIKVRQSHYLIYGITDIDSKKHVAYSFGDKYTLNLLQQAATTALEQDPDNPHVAELVSSLSQGDFPPPTRLITGVCRVSSPPFVAEYGPGNEVVQDPGDASRFTLKLAAPGGGRRIALTFTGLKPEMLVNGDGNTGLRVRSDMHYVSLTRNSVAGFVDTGDGRAAVRGDGWFDHQWGNSWTTQSAGWDWWGTQLNNGTDILFFRQLNLKTGQPFFPCATFEDAAGNQVTTHNIVFQSSPASIWRSPRTGVEYPLQWTVSFPDQQTVLTITPDADDQEMPVLANGGAIWEGSCAVAANVKRTLVSGNAYMELVGYGCRAVKLSLAASAAPETQSTGN